MAKDKKIIPPIETKPHQRAVHFDVEKYRPFLEDENISEEDKAELLQAVWNIVLSFVKLGYGVHPVQQAKQARRVDETACGQFGRNPSQTPLNLPFELYSKDQSLIAAFAPSSGPNQTVKET